MKKENHKTKCPSLVLIFSNLKSKMKLCCMCIEACLIYTRCSLSIRPERKQRRKKVKEISLAQEVSQQQKLSPLHFRFKSVVVLLLFFHSLLFWFHFIFIFLILKLSKSIRSFSNQFIVREENKWELKFATIENYVSTTHKRYRLLIMISSLNKNSNTTEV